MQVIKQADGRVLQTFGYRFISEDLHPSSSYQRSTTFFVRDIWTTGMYQIEVATDVTNTVFEFEYENNNEASQNMQIVQSLADLVISDANGTVSQNLISGESVLVLNWTVTNVGPGATGGDRIIDTVVVIQCNGRCVRRTLESVVTMTNLLPESNYNVANREFPIPSEISGNIRIEITTSFNGLESGTGSNVIDIFLTIPCLSPLLETRNLTISNAFDELDSFTAGEDIKLTWSTVNVGNLTALTNSVTAIVSLVSQKRHPLRNVLLTSALVPSDSLQVNISVRLPLTVNGIVSFTVSYEQDESVCVSVSPVYFGPYSINPPPTPSLEVSDVGWEILQSGTAIFVSWRVTNVGNTMIAESEWYDEVTIVSDISLGTDNSFSLGVFPTFGQMETGQSYSTSKTLPVPQNAAGTVSVAVTSTYELVPGEPLLLGTAVAQSRVLLTLPEPGIPDLAVTNITGFPLNVSFGSFITIRYEVQNMGASTTSSSWTDCIYLVQPFFEELVVKSTRIGVLDTKDKYITTVGFRIPFALNGLAQIQVATDVTLQERESNRENNVKLSSQFNLYEGPRGDLVAAISSSALDLGSGEPFTFRYNVTNVGPATIENAWIDAIYLSQDSSVDPFDTRLSSSPTSATLASGDTFQKNVEVFLPFDLPAATYYLIVDIDSRGEVFEEDENNNIDQMTFDIRGGFSSDLAVTSVNAPVTASFGASIAIDWVVENLGLQMVRGYKCDTVYLSDNEEWSIMDYEVGRICNSFLLDGLSSVPLNTDIVSLEAQVPLVPSGELYTIVRTRSNVRDLRLENNIGIDDNVVIVSLPLLELEVPLSAQLEFMQRLAYRIPSVPSDETLIVSLESTSNFGVNSLFLRFNDVASPHLFDSASQGQLSANQTVVLTPTRQGEYYLLVQNNGVLDNRESYNPSTITLSAKIAAFEIMDIKPRQVAPLGMVTISVEGTVFPEDIYAKIRNRESGFELDAVEVFRFSSQELFATFDLSSTDVGSSFDLILNNVAEFPEALEMINGTQGTTTISVNNPTRLRPFEVGIVDVVISNTGNTDVLSPLLTLSVTTPGEALLINGGPTADWSPSHVFFGSPSKGPAGVLIPGSFARYTFQVRLLYATGTVNVKISSISSDDESIPNLYADDKDFYRPLMYSDERWNRVWDIFLEATGPSHASFMRQMSNVLNQLSVTGSRAPLLEQAMTYQLDLIDGFGDLSAVDVDIVDIQELRNEKGLLTLEYTRTFDSRLSSRTVVGAFGRGWKSLWW